MNVHGIKIPKILTLAALLCACLIGCTAQSEDLLAYQPRIISIDLEESGRLWHITPDGDGYTAETAGITFRISDTEAYAAVGGITVPLGERMRTAVSEPIACITLDADAVADVKSDPAEGCVILTFADGTAAAVRDGSPLWFEHGGKRYTVRQIAVG